MGQISSGVDLLEDLDVEDGAILSAFIPTIAMSPGESDCAFDSRLHPSGYKK